MLVSVGSLFDTAARSVSPLRMRISFPGTGRCRPMCALTRRRGRSRSRPVRRPGRRRARRRGSAVCEEQPAATPAARERRQHQRDLPPIDHGYRPSHPAAYTPGDLLRLAATLLCGRVGIGHLHQRGAGREHRQEVVDQLVGGVPRAVDSTRSSAVKPCAAAESCGGGEDVGRPTGRPAPGPGWRSGMIWSPCTRTAVA